MSGACGIPGYAAGRCSTLDRRPFLEATFWNELYRRLVLEGSSTLALLVAGLSLATENVDIGAASNSYK